MEWNAMAMAMGWANAKILLSIDLNTHSNGGSSSNCCNDYFLRNNAAAAAVQERERGE